MKWLDPALAREFAAAGTDAYRILDAEGLWIERFGDGAVISYSMAEPTGIVGELARWSERAGVDVQRIYGRRLVTGPGRSDAPYVIGHAHSHHLGIAREEGLSYEVDFMAGYSCGLFLDQRANRRRVRADCSGALLNLFCYTCSFSVVAAAAGACTVNIDLSRTALKRGRHNFALNELSTKGHRFLADDVLDVLPRLARRGAKFSWIILDPPTFSRGRGGRVMRTERDYSWLIEMTLACAAPGAMILLSTNCSTLDPPRLRALARNRVRGPLTFFNSQPLPDIPAKHRAATVWMRIEA
jgi:23S rRNA (cytosine1962-C5)-methyltransferase